MPSTSTRTALERIRLKRETLPLFREQRHAVSDHTDTSRVEARARAMSEDQPWDYDPYSADIGGYDPYA